MAFLLLAQFVKLEAEINDDPKSDIQRLLPPDTAVTNRFYHRVHVLFRLPEHDYAMIVYLQKRQYLFLAVVAGKVHNLDALALQPAQLEL